LHFFVVNYLELKVGSLHCDHVLLAVHFKHLAFGLTVAAGDDLD
jgi:hypothetical protein